MNNSSGETATGRNSISITSNYFGIVTSGLCVNVSVRGLRHAMSRVNEAAGRSHLHHCHGIINGDLRDDLQENLHHVSAWVVPTRAPIQEDQEKKDFL